MENIYFEVRCLIAQMDIVGFPKEMTCAVCALLSEKINIAAPHKECFSRVGCERVAKLTEKARDDFLKENGTRKGKKKKPKNVIDFPISRGVDHE